MDIQGWVLYDGACGFCREWVPFWGPTLRKRGFDIAPLQAPWVRDRVTLADGDLLDDLRLLLRDGRQIQGADVYRHVMRRIWWAWPFWLLSCAPGFRRLFDATYRTFATNRHRFSRACGLPGATGDASTRDEFDLPAILADKPGVPAGEGGLPPTARDES